MRVLRDCIAVGYAAIVGSLGQYGAKMSHDLTACPAMGHDERPTRYCYPIDGHRLIYRGMSMA